MLKVFRIILFVFLFSCSLEAGSYFRKKVSEAFTNPRDRILVDTLKGVIFLTPQVKEKEEKKIEKKQIDGFEGIEIIGIEIPNEEEFFKQMSSFLGEPISIRKLQAIRETTKLFYKKRGYHLADVIFPKGQKITAGVVQFIISIGKLGDVKVEGGEHFSKQQIADFVRTEKDEEISFDKMQDDLDWMNSNPFRRVDLYYETGKKIGQTDVILRMNDKTPFRLYGGYENTGNINAGKSRFLAGLNWGNIFKLDHRFNYQYMAAPSIKGWQGHSYSYIAPLPCRHILKVFGSYVRSISDRDEYRYLTGKSWYVGARYYIPFRVGKIKNEFHMGYDFKRTNNFLSYQTKLIYNTYMDVSQFTVGLKGIYEYLRGETAWNFIGYLSPGEMTKYNETIYFQVERSGNQANYFYFDLHLDQTIYLPFDFSWVFTSEYQYSSGKLLPSEQLDLGGYYTVRGYQENDVISDRGILIKNEIRSPVINISRDQKKKSEVIYLVFCDFGWASKVDQNILDKDNAILASLGLGLRYNLMNYVNLQLDYGWQLNRVHRLADSSSSRSRAHLGLVLSY